VSVLDPPENYVLLCDASELGLDELKELLASFNPLLASLEPYTVGVPTCPARTQEELPAMTAIWPVTFSPWRNKPEDERQWTPAKKAWVRAGIMRVLSEAVAAGEAGEIPSAVHCTAAPPCVQPQEQGFILPTPDMRASACDMRRSQGHPLRHAAMSCIASIARLRTVPPFSTVNPTRNGADYLLTSLSLFASHEPCVMCSMALLHSRVREVYYVFPRTVGGGLGGVYGVHGHQGLNHKFEVWRWTGAVDDSVRSKLVIEDSLDL
jgi:tRNA-specific adenosine deaminase 3